jgi:hypothetical protein
MDSAVAALTSHWMIVAALVVAAIAALFIFYISWRGRLRTGGAVFRASRFSSGNHLFPTQVVITPSSVVHFRPQWIGKLEHSIHIAHIASVRIDTNLLFSNVYIETTGGTSAVSCSGHHKADAVRMKQLIEQYQTDYYKK